MLVSIASVDTAGPKARRLVFADGEPFRETSAPVIKDLGLQACQTWDRDDLEVRLLDSERVQSWDRALRMLGYRDRTTKEIRTALLRDGYPEQMVAVTVERLVDLRLLDDSRFAAGWVRTRYAAGYGAKRIARELAEKGVEAGISAEALEQERPEDALSLARKALHGRTAAPGRERDRLVRRLLARGFTLEVALEATSVQEPPSRSSQPS